MAKEVQSASMVQYGSIESSIATRFHGTCHSDGVSLEKGFHGLSQTKELRSKIAPDLVDKVLVGGIDHEDRAKVVSEGPHWKNLTLGQNPKSRNSRCQEKPLAIAGYSSCTFARTQLLGGISMI